MTFDEFEAQVLARFNLEYLPHTKDDGFQYTANLPRAYGLQIWYGTHVAPSHAWTVSAYNVAVPYGHGMTLEEALYEIQTFVRAERAKYDKVLEGLA